MKLSLGWSLATLLGLGCLRAQPAGDRPNILFCVADDASYAHLSADGCTWVQTPAFDRVAREGIRFTRAYTPNAKCAPSRACILTGRNSWQLEELANHWAYYPEKYRSFMEALHDRGYWVGYTGKPWLPGIVRPIDGRPRELTGTEFNAARCTPPTKDISPTDYAANFREFLRRRPKGEPFCFWYGGWEPHRPYEYGSGRVKGHMSTASITHVPAYWPDDERVRNDMLDYAYEIEYFDLHLGKMLDALEQAGELDNTLVIVTSDNGMPFPRSKGQEYEISNHMPFAVMWRKGIRHAGRTADEYVSFIDIAPTALEAAGVEAAGTGMSPIQGRSLGPIFRDEGDPRRDHILIGREREDVGRPNDEGYPIRGIIKEGWLYLKNFEATRWPAGDPITGYMDVDGSPTKTAILASNRKGIDHWMWDLDFGLHPPEELYHVTVDPDCVDNQAGNPTESDRLARLRSQLLAELAQQSDPRLAGQGSQFDRYPFADKNIRDYYNRAVLHGEKIPALWIEPTDFEARGFDPANPLPLETPGEH